MIVSITGWTRPTVFTIANLKEIIGLSSDVAITEFDARLGRNLDAAISFAEVYLKKALAAQTVRESYAFSDLQAVNTAEISKPIVSAASSITSVNAIAKDGTATSIAADQYHWETYLQAVVFDPNGTFLEPADDNPTSVEVTYNVPAQDINGGIQSAVNLLAARTFVYAVEMDQPKSEDAFAILQANRYG